MNYYSIIPCPDYATINANILRWVQERDTVLTSDDFWNVIDHRQFLRDNPGFLLWCLENNLRIAAIAVTVGRHENCCGIHTDTPPARYKLSWPIQNTQGTYNRWYRSNCDTPTVTKNDLGGVLFMDKQELVEVARMEVLQPCLIDAGIPHDVLIEPGAQFPRLGLQCQLFNEPESL